jgi:hypothetical protein
MRARIYRPAKTPMQSGVARTNLWLLEFAPNSARQVDPLMGWTSSDDTQSQVRLSFESKKAAQAYAKDNGIEAIIQEAEPRKHKIRQGGYAENFATNRRETWTH